MIGRVEICSSIVAKGAFERLSVFDSHVMRAFGFAQLNGALLAREKLLALTSRVTSAEVEEEVGVGVKRSRTETTRER